MKMILKAIFAIISGVISTLIPKDKNLWIFGAYSGLRYADNSKYLFEYVASLPHTKVIWLTASKQTADLVRSKSYKSYTFYSIKGVWYALRAKYAVLCCAFDDVGPFTYVNPEKLKIVQLFHGTPLKRLDSTIESTSLVSLFREIINLYVGRKYDYVFTTSEISGEALNKHFRISKDKFYITGYPRNDRIFLDKKNEFLLSLKRDSNFDKVVLYLPTWREYTVKYNPHFNLFVDYGFNIESLTNVLKKENALMLIKIHYKDAERAKDVLNGLKDNKNIILISDRDIEDPYVLLSEVDILVTDYSSIYFDYLLLNRPIIFTPFDLENYKKHDRGFYFSYEENTPGPKVFSWRDFEGVLSKEFKNPEAYSSLRMDVNQKFNTFQDGDACKRIVSILEG